MRAFALSTLPLLALAIPAPSSSIHSLARRADIVPFIIEDGCRASGQYNKMLHAIQAARSLAQVALKEWWDEGKHGEVAATYLAIPDDGNYKNNEYAKIVQENLHRVSVLSESVPLLSKFIDINCKDKSNKCGDVLEGKHIAGYAENPTLILGNFYDVVLCSPWFSTPTADAAYNEWKSQPKADIAMDWLETDGGKMLHELMHINFITEDRPHIIDVFNNGARMYGSKAIAEWVRDYKAKTSDVVNNADSYTQFANAIDMKNRFGFLPPPTREVPLSSTKECFGEDDKYVDSHLAENHIDDFCTKLANTYKPNTYGDFSQEYDQDTPEHVQLRMRSTFNAHLSAENVESQCRGSLPQIIHGCDTTTSWKHGGSLTWGDNTYEYYVTPQHERPLPPKLLGKCNVYYKFVFDEFDIYGGNWAGNDHGQSQLLPNLRRCGPVSAWSFEYYTEIQESGYEWKAYGRLPIGSQQWNCVRKAVVDSGGPSDIGCGGS